VKFSVKKWKVPIVAASGEFLMVTLPHKGFSVGEGLDWVSVSTYMQQLGYIDEKPKGEKGYTMMVGNTPTSFANETQMKKFYYGNKDFRTAVREVLMKELLELNNKMMEGGEQLNITADGEVLE
jgi:recombination protein RecA